MTTFKKDQVKGISFNKFYSFFLVNTASNIVLFNSFTGFKLLSINLCLSGQSLPVKSVQPVAAFKYSMTQYIMSSEGKICTFDLLDRVHLHPEPQSRMLKQAKNVAEFNLEVRQLTDLQRDLTFERWNFCGNTVRSKTKNSMPSLRRCLHRKVSLRVRGPHQIAQPLLFPHAFSVGTLSVTNGRSSRASIPLADSSP